jgi:hypothetical protein
VFVVASIYEHTMHDVFVIRGSSRVELAQNMTMDVWDDDEQLIELHRRFGNRWTDIAKCLEGGRSARNISRHYQAVMARVQRAVQRQKLGDETALAGALKDHITRIMCMLSWFFFFFFI